MAITMAWDQANDKYFENGIDRGVLYPYLAGAYPAGHPWNGLISITDSPEGAEPTDLYANNAKYATLLSAEKFGGTIEAYTFPDEFKVCDGTAELITGVGITMQTRQAFGLSYRTKINSEGGGLDVGYKIHLVYGCLASPSEMAHSTVNESPEAVTFSWEFSSTPVEVTGFVPTSKLVVSSLDADPAFLTWLEQQLYGDDTPATDSNLPTPADILAYTP